MCVCVCVCVCECVTHLRNRVLTYEHEWYPRGVMVRALDCGNVACEFDLQSRYYVTFQANTLGKGLNPLILPAMG